MPTEQEQFWAGPEGDSYAARNGTELLPAKIALFSRALMRADDIGSAIEFGANRGLNIRALHGVLPLATFAAVEINAEACNALQREFMYVQGSFIEICHASVLDFGKPWRSAERTFDLSLSMGLLIHIHPNDLPKAYDTLYRSSRRYVLVAEYFSRTPTEIEYRGEMGRLWKRDFASEMLARYPDLKVADYGFVWRLDPVAPLDDITWALLEKAT